LLARFRERLASAPRQKETECSRGGPERKLLEADYFSLFFFGLLNPVVDSMRGLCAASHIQRVQEEVCSAKVSLGSFSEAQSVFDAVVLQDVFMDLAQEAPAKGGDPRLADYAEKLRAIDGTLLPALPRMHWALWINDENRATKLHLKFKDHRRRP